MAMAPLLEELAARRKAAQSVDQLTQPLRDDVYKYVIPFRKGTSKSGAGEKRVDEIFDHTAGDAAFRFAGKLQQDLWPAGEQNFELEPGVLVPENEQEQFKKILAKTTNIVHAACFEDGEFDLAFVEMALDLVGGTGAVLMNGGDGAETVWEPISVPIDELIIEAGPNNKISGMFWLRKMTLRQIFDTWPEGIFSADLTKLRKENPAKEIDVRYDVFFEKKKKKDRSRWKIVIWCKEQDEAISMRSTKTSIWAIPRYFRVPGEVKGRGPAMLAMPGIKTLNTAQRLYLQAAAIALMGIYTGVDDGVFNPDNSPVTPGAVWKVARNGGPLGPSINRLPDPRLDLAGIVVENIQMNVKASMLDQALPVDGAAVKSATEIIERVKRLANDHVGAFGRLTKELITPVVKRAIETCYDAGLLPEIVDINQLLVRVKVKSPLAIANEIQRVQKIMQWLEMVFAILAQTGDPSRINEIAKVDDMLRDIGPMMGVPEKYAVSKTEAEKIQKQKQEQAMALAAAGAMAQAGGGNGAPPAAGGLA